MIELERQLLNGFQRGFPLVRRPFEVLAAHCGSSEREVLDRLGLLFAGGIVSRVGAVFAPGRIGASTLLALAVPEQRLAEVGALLSAFEGINHSYEREHAYNLWAVATAQDEIALQALLARIERVTALSLLDLRLIEEYRIDLGFDLFGQRSTPAPARMNAARRALDAAERRLAEALQDGLPIVPEPFMALGSRAQLSEAAVLQMLAAWIADGTIRRFGVIVRHHELGYCANAMAVWDVPDELASGIGRGLAQCAEVTLAYRRRRWLPQWPYNLFCMVHGKERRTVIDCIGRLGRDLDLERYPHAMLFSRRRFKQTGARYLTSEPQLAHG